MCQVKIESFTSVAAQLDLLSAIFDSLLGTGSQLLVYTVPWMVSGVALGRKRPNSETVLFGNHPKQGRRTSPQDQP